MNTIDDKIIEAIELVASNAHKTDKALLDTVQALIQVVNRLMDRVNDLELRVADMAEKKGD